MKTQMIREPGRDYFVEWQASQARLSEMRKRVAKLSADLTGIDRDALPKRARAALASMRPVIDGGIAHFTKLLKERPGDAAIQGQLDNARRWSAVFEWITADDEEAAKIVAGNTTQEGRAE